MERVPTDLGFQEKIIHALTMIKMGSAEEIASQIVELEGITSEEGVAEVVIAVREGAEKLAEAGDLEVVRNKHASKRYVLKKTPAA